MKKKIGCPVGHTEINGECIPNKRLVEALNKLKEIVDIDDEIMIMDDHGKPVDFELRWWHKDRLRERRGELKQSLQYDLKYLSKLTGVDPARNLMHVDIVSFMKDLNKHPFPCEIEDVLDTIQAISYAPHNRHVSHVAQEYFQTPKGYKPKMSRILKIDLNLLDKKLERNSGLDKKDRDTIKEMLLKHKR